MDVAADGTFGGGAAGFLFSAGDAFLAKPLNGLVGIAFRGGQGLFAIHHPRAGLVAQFFDKLGGYGSSHRSEQ